MHQSQLEKIIRKQAAEFGLKVVSLEVTRDDPPFDSLPIVNMHVERASPSESKAIHAAMKKFEKGLGRAIGDAGIRTGYYDADIEYDDVPVDQAMIQIDCFSIDVEFSTDPEMRV